MPLVHVRSKPYHYGFTFIAANVALFLLFFSRSSMNVSIMGVSSRETHEIISVAWLKLVHAQLNATRESLCANHTVYVSLSSLNVSKEAVQAEDEHACLFNNATMRWAAHNPILKSHLWNALVGTKDTLTFGVSGGSSMAGAGPGVGPPNVFSVFLKDYLGELLVFANSTTRIVVENVGQGFTGSLWGGLYLHELFGKAPDILFWEFAINDYAFEGVAKNEALEVWLRKALQFQPVPALGLLYLWDQPHRDNKYFWPSLVVEEVQDSLVRDYGIWNDIHTWSVGQYANTVWTKAHAAGVDYSHVKKSFVTDWHHPTKGAHQIAAQGFFYMYLGVLLDIVQEIMASHNESAWPHAAKVMTGNLTAEAERHHAQLIIKEPVMPTSDPLLELAMTGNRGGYVFFGPTFNNNQSLQRVDCNANVSCDPQYIGKIDPTSVRTDMRSGVKLPQCNIGSLNFRIRSLSINQTSSQHNNDNDTMPFNHVRYVGVNLLMKENGTVAIAYGGPEQIEMKASTCLVYNGNPMKLYDPQANSLRRGLLAPTLYYTETHTDRERLSVGTQSQCDHIVDMNKGLGGHTHGVIQLCASEPFLVTSVVVFYD